MSPRPHKSRRVESEPKYTHFEPAGDPLMEIAESKVTVVEFEAVRLKDFEGLDQMECAKRMNVSRPTFQRILGQARIKIAQALVEGKSIKIEGGIYEIATGNPVCNNCNYNWNFPVCTETFEHDIECPNCR